MARRHAPPLPLFALLVSLAACRAADAPGDPVDVLYAGSLTATMESAIAPAFETVTGRVLRGEPHGSVAAAHQIREGVRRPDLYISADPATLPLLGEYDPGWAIAFAGGEMAIGYGPRSRFAAGLDSAAAGLLPWYEVLGRPGFRFGRTDPALDPKGYRTVWMFELAEERYGIRGLARRLLEGWEGSGLVYPEPHLPARVQAGALDAGAFYLAEGLAHGLRMIRLPPEVHQGSPALAGLYGRRRFETPSGAAARGTPILYVATIPLNAPDPVGGRALLAFLLEPAGRERLEEAGFPSVAHLIGDAERTPPALREAVAATNRGR